MKTVKLVKLIIQPFYIVMEDNEISGDISSKDPIQVFERDLPKIQETVKELTEKMQAHVSETKS